MAAISCISGVALPARISARRSGKHPIALPGTARNRPASVSRFSTLSAREKPRALRRTTGRSFRPPRRAREARTRMTRSLQGSGLLKSRVRVAERACRASSRPRRAVSERVRVHLQRLDSRVTRPRALTKHALTTVAPPSRLHRHPGQGRAHAPRRPRLRVRARHEDRRVSTPAPNPPSSPAGRASPPSGHRRIYSSPRSLLLTAHPSRASRHPAPQ